jgi:hypothetical protein
MVPTSWKKIRRGFYQNKIQSSAARAKKNQLILQLVEFIQYSYKIIISRRLNFFAFKVKTDKSATPYHKVQLPPAVNLKQVLHSVCEGKSATY